MTFYCGLHPNMVGNGRSCRTDGTATPTPTATATATATPRPTSHRDGNRHGHGHADSTPTATATPATGPRIEARDGGGPPAYWWQTRPTRHPATAA